MKREAWMARAMGMTTTTTAALLLALVLPAKAVAQRPDQPWAALRYDASLFDDDTEPWQQASLEVGSRHTRLTPIARVNFASRNGAESVQFEGDLYPAWPGVGYAYLSAGWSASLPFPELRLAGELFAALPAGFEASVGVVYMDFPAGDATVLVGSLARYAGNYWFGVRPSWTNGSNELALSLFARRYLRSATDFVTLRLIAGATPEEIETTGSTGVNTLGLVVDGQLELSRRWALLPILGVVREEPGNRERMRFTLGAGGMYRF